MTIYVIVQHTGRYEDAQSCPVWVPPSRQKATALHEALVAVHQIGTPAPGTGLNYQTYVAVLKLRSNAYASLLGEEEGSIINTESTWDLVAVREIGEKTPQRRDEE